MSSVLTKKEEENSPPPANPHSLNMTQEQDVMNHDDFTSPLSLRERTQNLFLSTPNNNFPLSQPASSPSGSAQRTTSISETVEERAAQQDRYLVIPVFAKSKLPSTTSYDVPAVRLFRARGDVTVAVYPLDRELLGEVWITPESLQEWYFERLPRAWADAERKFLPLIEYPLEYLQALLIVLRTQQFLDGTIFTNSTWKKACRRPIPLITISKPCSACHVVRQFAARTLLTAPKQFPPWKCSHLGMECNEDVDTIIYTVPPEQWQLAAPERSFSSSQDALPSFPFDKHSQRPPSTAVSLSKLQPNPKGPEIFDVATPPPRSRAARENAANSPSEDTFRPLQQHGDCNLSHTERRRVPKIMTFSLITIVIQTFHKEFLPNFSHGLRFLVNDDKCANDRPPLASIEHQQP